MVIDTEIIHARLAVLETYVQELKSLQNYSLEDLAQNLSNLWTVAHGLQLCIQIVLDVGNHILSDLGIKAGDYTEIIDQLGKKGVIPVDFARNIRGMAGLRNVLVHGYISLNVTLVHQILQERLGDFLEFAHYINEYLSGR